MSRFGILIIAVALIGLMAGVIKVKHKGASIKSLEISSYVSFKTALADYVENFDSEYIDEHRKNNLNYMISNASYVWINEHKSTVYPTEGGYRLELDSALFGDGKVTQREAKKELKNNRKNFKLILTLVHEHQHFKDFNKRYIQGVYKNKANERYSVASFVSGTLAEYFAYKEEFLIWKEWHDQLGFPLPICHLYKKGKWFEINAAELTAQQYGFGKAWYDFSENMLPNAKHLVAATTEAKKLKKNIVIDVRNQVNSTIMRLDGVAFKYDTSLADNTLSCR